MSLYHDDDPPNAPPNDKTREPETAGIKNANIKRYNDNALKAADGDSADQINSLPKIACPFCKASAPDTRANTFRLTD
jgi:hypothetical protein